MTGVDLRVEARDQDIIVTMPENQLSGGVSLDYFQHEGPITRAQFLARAWELAIVKRGDGRGEELVKAAKGVGKG